MLYLQTYFFFFWIFNKNKFFRFNFFFFFTTLIYYCFYYNNYFNFNQQQNIFFLIKYCLIFLFYISFFLFFLTFICFLFYINEINKLILFLPNYLSLKYIFFFNIFFFNWSEIYLIFDFFGLLLLFLAYIVGFLSLLILDNRLYLNNLKYYFTFNIFLIIVYFYTTTSNYLLFFFFYECLLLPSFLFVYFISPSRRAIQASIYFVIWTQIGSILVFLVISYLLVITNSFYFFSLKFYNFSEFEIYILYCLLFLGFGFKVPIWPFHYWLTKTHVEAPSGFSIYLSGFLVKSALYGFFKLTNIFSISIDNLLFSLICILGVIDSSLKMWGQTDLKKLVAYGTIQEMNLIFLVFIWGDSKALLGGIIFTVVHAYLSALMFFLVDCIYRRFNSRSIIEVNGILQQSPILGLNVILMTIFFAGLPGTLKFVVEFYIFSGLIEISFTMCFFIIFIANVLGLIGFCKSWFNVLFGVNIKAKKAQILDLTKKEIFFLIFIYFSLFFFSFFPYFLI